MGYERDEAMRQQEATEAMIRMREPRRPSEGPFMPCPAKVTILYNITLSSEYLMPKRISDKVLNPSCLLVEMDRQWQLEVCVAPGTRGMTIWMRLDSDDNQIGDTTFSFDDGDGNEYSMGNLDLNPEVCRIIGLFLAKDFNTITDMLFENAKAREAEARVDPGSGGYLLDMESKFGDGV